MKMEKTDKFSLKNKYALVKPIHAMDFIELSPKGIATVINNISNILYQSPKKRCSHLFTKLLLLPRIRSS